MCKYNGCTTNAIDDQPNSSAAEAASRDPADIICLNNINIRPLTINTSISKLSTSIYNQWYDALKVPL